MKKIFYFAAIAAIALVSCQEKNAPVIEEKTDAFTFKASIEQPETKGNVAATGVASSDIVKATINGSNQLLWATGDQIGVYFPTWGEKYQSFTLSGGAGTTTGEFTRDQSGEYLPTDATVAYFPWRSGTNWYADNLYFELPAEYWSYDDCDMLTPLVAPLTSSSDISFKHAGAAVKLTINNLVSGTYKVKMSVTDKQITGHFHINPTNAGTDAMALNDAEDPSKNIITLNSWKSDGAFSWIFPVPTLTSPTLSFEIIDENGVPVWSRTASNQQNVGRADLLVLPALSIVPYKKFDETATWGLCGTHNSWNGDTKMVTDGSLCIAKSMAFAANDEFKLRNNGVWGDYDSDNFGANSLNTAKSSANATKNGENIKITVAGTYDVIFNASASSYGGLGSHEIRVVPSKYPYPQPTVSASISITDDTFTDWNDVPQEVNGTTTLKVASDATNLYFYIQRNSTPTTVWGNGGYVWITLDLDNDPSTGSATAWDQKYEFADYIYPYGGTADAPAFNTSPVGQSAGVHCSLRGELSGTTATYEFLIPRAELPTIPNSQITVKVMGNKDMSTVSAIRKL